MLQGGKIIDLNDCPLELKIDALNSRGYCANEIARMYIHKITDEPIIVRLGDRPLVDRRHPIVEVYGIAETIDPDLVVLDQGQLILG